MKNNTITNIIFSLLCSSVSVVCAFTASSPLIRSSSTSSRSMMVVSHPSARIIINDRRSRSSSNKISWQQLATADNEDVQSLADVDVVEEEKKELSFPILLWKFSRPHTLIGSAVAVPALHCLAAPHLSSIFTVNVLKSCIISVFPALLINIYITGLNQITDVDIDKINKPYLPIAAGLLSIHDAKVVVSACLFLGLLSGSICGSTGLNIALWGSAILGTIYSLPPFRLKRFPFLAATCIVAVRGTIINVGFFAHAQQSVFGNTNGILRMFMTDQKCLLSSLFFGIFGIVIALMKDVPDVAGDAIANIRSFSVRVGQKTIFKGARRLLSILLYGFGIGFLNGTRFASDTTVLICRAVVGSISILAGFKVRQKSLGVDPEDSNQVYDYYMYLWKIFYASYFVLPFAR